MRNLHVAAGRRTTATNVPLTRALLATPLRTVMTLLLALGGLGLPVLAASPTAMAASGGPSITSVTINGTVDSNGYVENPTITITGSGFNPAPTATSVGYAGFSGLDYGTALHISDITDNPHAWNAGFDDPSQHDFIGLDNLSYSDTQISYTFGTIYPDYYGVYQLNVGDQFKAFVRNVWCTGTVVIGTPIPCGNLSLNPTVTPNPVTLNGSATASSGATDTLSNIASQGCGPVDTSTTGNFTVNCWASNDAGNYATGTASYTVTNGICTLYDQSQAKKSGSTIPVKLQLCDASGANISSPDITVTALDVNGDASLLHMSGKANPGNVFRYDPSLDGYIFNLKTTGLGSGSYTLDFSVSGDPTTHSVTFAIK